MAKVMQDSSSVLRLALVRLRLFVHVLAHGCRIVSVEALQCKECEHRRLCNAGYFDPEGGSV